MPHHNPSDIINHSDFNQVTLQNDNRSNKNLDGKWQFIQYLRSMTPNVHFFHNKIFVITCNSTLFNCQKKINQLTHDITLLHGLGIQIVLIYGPPPEVKTKSIKDSLSLELTKDMIIDSQMIQSIKEATGLIRFNIEAAFSQGLPNTPMADSSINIASGNFITARPVGVINGIDYQFLGIVSKIDKTSIIYFLENKKIVLLSPIGFSVTGDTFTLTIEDLASSVASALHAQQLIYLTDFNKLINHTQDQNILTNMCVNEAEKLLETSNKLSIDFSNYLKMAIHSCRNGVHQTCVLPFDLDGAVLMKLFNQCHIGYTITENILADLRPATLHDIDNIIKLISPLEQNGTLVKRDRYQLQHDILNFSVIEKNQNLLGCAALFPYFEEKMGEMACLTVFPQVQGTGHGEKLLQQIEKRAKNLGLKKIFVLTVRTEHWFLKRGFSKSSVDCLPNNKRKLYNWQRRSLVLIKDIL